LEVSFFWALVDAEVTAYSRPIAYNPCLECKLCVAACPTGAISADGYFDFSACQTHNYREFMGGFTDWVEKIADSLRGLPLVFQRGAAKGLSATYHFTFTGQEERKATVVIRDQPGHRRTRSKA